MPPKKHNPTEGFRAEQTIYYDQIVAAMKLDKRVIMAEGATGIGKSYVIAEIAYNMLVGGKKRVVVAAPTIDTLLTLIEAWKLRHGDISWACTIGKQHFVNDNTLLEICNSIDTDKPLASETIEKIKTWIAAGGPTVENSPSSRLATLVPGLSFLADDLLELCPEITGIQGLRLSDSDSGESCKAQVIYNGMRTNAALSRLVFCSHAMLAYDLMTRGKLKNQMILGPFDACLIDEAHDLEKNIASARMKSTSILAIRARLKAFSALTDKEKHDVSKACNTVHESFKDLCETAGLQRGQLHINPTKASIAENNEYLLDILGSKKATNSYTKFRSSIESLLALMKKAVNKRGAKKLAGAKDIQEHIATFTEYLEAKQHARISGSPVWHWPSIASGKISVDWDLLRLWEDVDQAVLFSATLSLPTKNGDSYGHMKHLLNLYKHQKTISVAELPPVIPAWVTSPVILHLPNTENALSLMPADSKIKDATVFVNQRQAWLKEIAARITTIGRQAKGGTLALSTAYADIADLIPHLPQDVLDRLIYRQRNISFNAERGAYQLQEAAGERPIWITLGSAWTGLNAEIEHLAIIKFPFNTNQTITHASRVDKNSAEAFAASAITLRQGIGRLVRTDGLKPGSKHLWLLDGRYYNTKGSYYQFKMVLDRYRTKKADV